MTNEDRRNALPLIRAWYNRRIVECFLHLIPALPGRLVNFMQRNTQRKHSGLVMLEILGALSDIPGSIDHERKTTYTG